MFSFITENREDPDVSEEEERDREVIRAAFNNWPVYTEHTHDDHPLLCLILRLVLVR